MRSDTMINNDHDLKLILLIVEKKIECQNIFSDEHNCHKRP